MAIKKLRRLRNRHFLRFTSINIFAIVVSAKIHPALAQTTEKTVGGNNSMNIALATNILEIEASLLLAVSLASAMLVVSLRPDNTNRLKGLGISLLGLLMAFFLVLMGGSLFLKHWTQTLVNIAWLSCGSFFVILIFALIP